MNRQTFHARNRQVERHWRHIDATGQVLGRMAVQIATILMGKDKPEYTPHHDVGDFVVVTNAEKVRLTGKKLDQKFFQTFSGHPSGRKTTSYRIMLQKHPERLLQRTVRRMLPKNKLARQLIKKLKVYRGPDHPHEAQKPAELGVLPAVDLD